MYEELIRKSELCLEASRRSMKKGAFSIAEMWQKKAKELVDKAKDLTIGESVK